MAVVYQQVDLWQATTGMQNGSADDDPLACEVASLRHALQELESRRIASMEVSDEAVRQLEAHNWRVADAGDAFYRAPYESGQQPRWVAWDEEYRAKYRDEGDRLVAQVWDTYHQFCDVYGPWRKCNERLTMLMQEQRFMNAMRRERERVAE